MKKDDPAFEFDRVITNEEYVDAARQKYGEEGRIEVDMGAKVSRGCDPGVYVQAWVWVYDEEVKK